MTEAGRPQDQGRRHRKGGAPSEASASLLRRWQEALRRELEDVLRELEGVEQPGGALLDGSQAPTRKRPSLETRAKLVALGVTLARELGTEVDPGPAVGEPAQPGRPRPRRGKVDFGGA